MWQSLSRVATVGSGFDEASPADAFLSSLANLLSSLSPLPLHVIILQGKRQFLYKHPYDISTETTPLCLASNVMVHVQNLNFNLLVQISDMLAHFGMALRVLQTHPAQTQHQQQNKSH